MMKLKKIDSRLKGILSAFLIVFFFQIFVSTAVLNTCEVYTSSFRVVRSYSLLQNIGIASLDVQERENAARELWDLYLKTLHSGSDRYKEKAEEIRKAIELNPTSEKAIYAKNIIDAIELRGKLCFSGGVFTGDQQILDEAYHNIEKSENYHFYVSRLADGNKRMANELIFNSVVHLGIPYEAVVLGIIGDGSYQGELGILKPVKENILDANPGFSFIAGGMGSEVAIDTVDVLMSILENPGALAQSILGEEKLEELRSKITERFSVVVEPPWDDGGSTRSRMDAIRDGNSDIGRKPHGWTPAVGDEARARKSSCCPAIKTLLSYRIPKKVAGLPAGVIKGPDMYEEYVKWAIDDLDSHKLQLGISQYSPEYIFFLSNMLNAGRIMDEVFSADENLGAAFKNDFTLAIRLEPGADASFDKSPNEEIDWKKFREETISLNYAQNVRDVHVVMNSFEEATLYIRLQDDNISMRALDGSTMEAFSFGYDDNGNPQFINNGKIVPMFDSSAVAIVEWAEENNLAKYLKDKQGDFKVENFDFQRLDDTAYKEVVLYADQYGKDISLLKKMRDNSMSNIEIAEVLSAFYLYTAQEPIQVDIGNGNFIPIVVQVRSNDILVSVDGSPSLSYNDFKNKFDTDDKKQNLSIKDEYGNHEFKVSYGTMVIQQTNITENFHQVRIKEFGTIDKYTHLKSNVEADNNITNTQNMIVVGPGSFYTSIMQNFIANADELYEMGQIDREGRPPRVFVFNPYYDNETQGQSIKDMIEEVEATLEKHGFEGQCAFEDLFDYVVINVPDTVKIAQEMEENPVDNPEILVKDPKEGGISADNYAKFLEDLEKNNNNAILDLGLYATAQKKQELLGKGYSGSMLYEELGEFLREMAENMDKSEEAREKALSRNDPTAFSDAAKLPRGPILVTEEDIEFLKNKGFSEEHIIRDSITSIVRQEKRKSGRAQFEEGVGYKSSLYAIVWMKILANWFEI